MKGTGGRGDRDDYLVSFLTDFRYGITQGVMLGLVGPIEPVGALRKGPRRNSVGWPHLVKQVRILSCVQYHIINIERVGDVICINMVSRTIDVHFGAG